MFDDIVSVGHNAEGEVVISHDNGFTRLSAASARELADRLTDHAREVESEKRQKASAELYAKAAAIPVDHSARTLADGSPVTPEHREINPESGQQKGYIVLSAAERAKGFVRPVRYTYVHIKCGVATTMGQSIAETYARSPDFYNATFCCRCRAHFPIGENGEFKWDDGTMVGT